MAPPPWFSAARVQAMSGERTSITVDGEALREWCRGKIASFKIPRYWRFVDEFPMTVTGKVQKFKMREASIAELGLEDAATTPTA